MTAPHGLRPTPPARIGGISALRGRRTGSVTSSIRSRIVRSGPEYGGRNPNMYDHEMITRTNNRMV